MTDERQIIERFFARSLHRPEVVVGIGDDAAVVRPPAGYELVFTTDTLVEDVHFLRDADARMLGHKSLAVNLSDLAAMGADPAYALLSLTLPRVDDEWLTAYSEGFFGLASRYGVALVGGNLARGPLSITIQATGHVPNGRALLRSGARPGDLVFVSGTLGDASTALRYLRGERLLGPGSADYCLRRLHAPEPRVKLGLALRGLASAACDVSDGLAQDLGRILVASGVGASIDVARLPLSESAGPRDVWSIRQALAGGDDYELVFTASPARAPEIERSVLPVMPIHCIGVIERQPGLRVQHQGKEWKQPAGGYDHFSDAGQL